MVPPHLRPASDRLDVFALHTRFNAPEIAAILQPDTTYVTVVRDPPALYESLYNYFNLSGDFGMSLEQFLDLPLEVVCLIVCIS